MNRCAICGRKLKNSETTCGVEFCKVCERYEQQLAEKDKEIRHKICEKITRFIRDNFVVATTNCSEKEQSQAIGYDGCLKDLRKLVDQIERGEEV